MAEYVQARINDGGVWFVVADLNHDNGRRVAEEIRKSGGRSLAIETDVSRPESESAMPAETLLAFQRIDILVNNAAIFPVSLEEWDLALRINLWGTFYCAVQECQMLLTLLNRRITSQARNSSALRRREFRLG